MPRPVHVLLVEDNAGDARLISELLNEGDRDTFIVSAVERLSTALEHVAARQPDVILLDLVRPDSHGIETFATMYAHTPSIPIIVLTGLSDESHVNATLREGAQDYLVKGEIDGRTLARSIRYAME